jgi:GNAT superfamily N-acetyltransferase
VSSERAGPEPAELPSDTGAVDGYLLRLATVADAQTIAEYRRLMFTAMGQVAPGQGDDLVTAMARHVEQELPAGRLLAWIVEQDGRPVAGGVLVLQQTAPAPGFLGTEPVGLIQNIWTEPAHRRRGLAGWMVRAMIGWCRERRIRRLFLNATEDGRSVYAALGFRPSTTAMTLTLDLDDQP